MENLNYWDKLKSPPQWALKKITDGRLKGKTDISPQWRTQVMTETFGPVGIGWKYTIDKTWTANASEGQIFIFASVSVCFRHEGEWSAPIQGIGSKLLVKNERKQIYSNEHSIKMAVTDALSVAFKMIGVGADIYLGFADAPNYHQQQNQQNRQPPRKLQT